MKENSQASSVEIGIWKRLRIKDMMGFWSKSPEKANTAADRERERAQVIWQTRSEELL